MFNKETLQYAEALIRSTKLQFVCAVSFGIPLLFYYEDIELLLKITLLVFALLPLSALFFSFGECLKKLYEGHKKKTDKLKKWNDLTNEEIEFVRYYIKENTKCRYVSAHHGAPRDSGIVNMLRAKGILYLANNQSEFRGTWQSGTHCFPFNIYDDAFEFFKKKLNDQ